MLRSLVGSEMCIRDSTSTGQAGFSTSYFTDALYVGTDVVTYTAGTTPPTQSLTPSDYEWSRLRGEDGDNGLDGFNTAVKSVYIRQETEPTTAPTETLTYTFSTASGIFPGSTQTSNGWSVFVPSGTDQLWERGATAVSRTDTDTIAPADWSGAIQSGSTGADGQDGINTATVYLYQRNSSDTAPADPNQQTTYVFSSGAVSPTNNNGWTPTIPAESNGTHLWVTFATAANRTSTDFIEASEFADPELLAVDGVNGESAEIMYSNAAGDSPPGNPTTMPNEWQSSTLSQTHPCLLYTSPSPRDS